MRGSLPNRSLEKVVVRFRDPRNRLPIPYIQGALRMARLLTTAFTSPPD